MGGQAGRGGSGGAAGGERDGEGEAEARAWTRRESVGGIRERRWKKIERGLGVKSIWIGVVGFRKNVMGPVFFCKNEKSSRFSLLHIEIKFTMGIYT